MDVPLSVQGPDRPGTIGAQPPPTTETRELPVPSRLLLAAPFVVSIFTGALLLFLLEPMIGRILLPEFGGGPAVWNTCMAVYQGLLLAGYAYAHWSVSLLGARRQAVLHAGLLLISAVTLPLAIPAIRQSGMSPALSIAAAVTMTIGLPFVLLAANSSLIQRWFSLRGGRDPFWLYATSNAGSLIGLLAYPFLFEPLFGLSFGWKVWAAIYFAFLLVSGVSLLSVWSSLERTTADDPMPADRPGWRARTGWALRAAVGSSLLLSVTMKITTDVTAGPVFWVAPLSLYLLSFIVAFSPRLRYPRPVVATLTALGIAWAMTVFLFTLPVPLSVYLGGMLATVFFGSLLCHADIASSRPAPSHLTEFYLWIALGGAIGGALNSFAAPLLLDSLAEYPLTLLMLSFLLHGKGSYLSRFPRDRMRSPATYLPAVTAVAVLSLTAWVIFRQQPGASNATAVSLWNLAPLAVLVLGLLFARHAGQFEVVIASLTAYVLLFGGATQPVVEQARSFFGVTKVVQSPTRRTMLHGTTIHGTQWRSGPMSKMPTSYFHPSGPFGPELVAGRPSARVGVVGLGVGALALIGGPGQSITFYEIDRDVETLARRHFTYLQDATAEVDVVIGDGRLLLRDLPDQTFDLLVLDAFSSDAIPAHLLTSEALALYLRKIKPDGLVVLQISNRAFDLARVLRGWSLATGSAVAVSPFRPTAGETAEGAMTATVAAVARDRRVLEQLVERGKWRWLSAGRSVLWTDDRIDLLAVIGQPRP